MSTRNCWILAVCLVFASLATAQEASKPTIKHVPIRQVDPTSGEAMYKSYCAVCHGVDGKGSGPAAEALKMPPTDLTQLAKMNGGEYPAFKVTSAIRGDANLPAHGSKDMPVWGTLFSRLSGGNEGEVHQRVTNLNRYIESLQAK